MSRQGVKEMGRKKQNLLELPFLERLQEADCLFTRNLFLVIFSHQGSAVQNFISLMSSLRPQHVR